MFYRKKYSKVVIFRSQIHHLGHLISHLQYLLEVEHSEKAAAAVVVVAAVAGQALSELAAAAAAELVVVVVAQGVALALVL